MPCAIDDTYQYKHMPFSNASLFFKREFYLSFSEQTVTFHDFFTQHHGQEFVVGDLLNNGGNNVSCLLENFLIVPVRVDFAEFEGDAVVFSHEDRM